MTPHLSPQSPGQRTVGDSEEEDEIGPAQFASAKDEVTSATHIKQPEALEGDRTQHSDRVLSKKEKNRRKRDNRKQRKKKLFRASLTNTEHVALSTSADGVQQACAAKEVPRTTKPNAKVVDDLSMLDEAFWNLEDF